MSLPTLHLAQPWALLLLLAIPPMVWLALRRVAPGARPARQHRVAAGLRALLLLCISGALAGLQLAQPSDRLGVVYLVDRSDSIGSAAQAQAQTWLGQSLAAMPAGDQAAIIAFGQSAMVERTLSESRELAPLQTQPATGRTDIGAAVRLALALVPPDRQRRLVILSDGRDTEGHLSTAVRTAAASGAAISVVPLTGDLGDEVAISAVEAPGQVRQNEQFAVTVAVNSTLATSARLRLYADGALMAEQTVAVQPGSQRFRLAVTAERPGFTNFQAEIEAVGDSRAANNQLAAYTTVRGPGRVLVVAESVGRSEPIVQALQASGLSLERTTPVAMPTTLVGLAAFEAVVLVDVDAPSLGPRGELLQQYVRDLGRGLVVIGGETSYGLGGYAGTPLEASLPVTMAVRNQQLMPQVALGLTLDKSGSMGRCHAEPGATAGSASMTPSGASKIDIAKEASLQSIRLLSPTDEVGIVAFDGQARWVAQRRPVGQQTDLVDRLGGLHAEGGTNIYAGLHEAVQSMLVSQARVKHIILVTDGWSRTGNFDDLLAQMRAAGITLSVIGAGGGAADLLRDLAERGGGRYYQAATMEEVPRIFLRETKLALRTYIQEGEFVPRRGSPSPILDGFDALPTLSGYIATTTRPTAQTVLVSDQRDPLLAQWQYGLGRAVAWTADAGERWASGWVGWSGVSRFWGQTVRWTLPRGDSELALQARVQGDRASLSVEAIASDGQPRDGLTTIATLVGPDGQVREQPLRQTGPGRYGLELSGLSEGAHLVTVVQRQGEALVATTSGGLVVGYSPEYTVPEPGARAGWEDGGDLWTAIERPEQAFERAGLAPAWSTIDLWPLLLLIAILLLPFDIAVRRLSLERGDWAALRHWLDTGGWWRWADRTARPRGTSSPTLVRLAGRLERVRAQRPAHRQPPERAGRPLVVDEPVTPPPPTAPPPADETLERLRRARQRARQRHQPPD